MSIQSMHIPVGVCGTMHLFSMQMF